ncbi:hypothetical protein Avbf_01651 [Armadillidium vulgare]|nr:hypothetical protein Avbf_01651 [Armadillidium vulgare]
MEGRKHDNPILDVIALTAEEIHDYQKQDPVLKQLYRAIKHNRLWDGSLKKFTRLRSGRQGISVLLNTKNVFHFIPWSAYTMVSVHSERNSPIMRERKLVIKSNKENSGHLYFQCIIDLVKMTLQGGGRNSSKCKETLELMN